MAPDTSTDALVAPNNLLSALRSEDLALLQPILTRWLGRAGDVIYEPGETVRYVYFPCGQSLISYFVILRDGKAVETALVGREGAIGGMVSQGWLPAYAKAEVQFAGPFLRVELAALEQAKSHSPTLSNMFARYADCLMAQVFQSVACNAAHTIEQRVAKWTLAAMDRTGTPHIPLTQEQLASMLGVGRSYVSRVLAGFNRREIIKTGRRSLTVLDVQQLEKVSCACNASVRQHFDEVLSGVYPSA